MKLISTTECKDYINVCFLDLSKICDKAIPKKSRTGDFYPKIFKTGRTTSYSKYLDPEWYKISVYFRSQTRFSFVYDTLPYVFQSLKIKPKNLAKYLDPIILIKSVQDEIIGNGITLITPNGLVKFIVTFIRRLIRAEVRKREFTKTIEERDAIVNSYLEKISPLLLPSCVLPVISFLGECYIPSQSEILAHMERNYDD